MDRSKLVRLFYPTQTSTDSRAKLDGIVEVSSVCKAYPLQFSIRPNRIHFCVQISPGPHNDPISIIPLFYLLSSVL